MQRQLQENRDRLAQEQREREAGNARVRKGMQQLVRDHERKLLDYIMRIRGDQAAIKKLLDELRQRDAIGYYRFTMDGQQAEVRSDAVDALRAKYPKFFETGDVTCLKKWWQFWK